MKNRISTGIYIERNNFLEELNTLWNQFDFLNIEDFDVFEFESSKNEDVPITKDDIFNLISSSNSFPFIALGNRKTVEIYKDTKKYVDSISFLRKGDYFFIHLDSIYFIEIPLSIINKSESVYIVRNDFFICENSLTYDWDRYFEKLPKYLDFINEFDYKDNKSVHILREKFAFHTHNLHNEDLVFKITPIMVVPIKIYKYIPKFLWDNLTNVNVNRTLPFNTKYIEIFNDFENMINYENYTKIWSVRKQLGMDTITHEICEPVKHLNWIDPDLPVYITLKTEKGGFTRVTRYFDKNGKLSSKSQAKSLEIKEFLEDGITCVFEETKQKGLFGWK